MHTGKSIAEKRPFHVKGFFMMEGMVCCAISILIALLSARYFAQNIQLYQKAQRRLHALELLHNSYETSWAKQAVVHEEKEEGYRLAYRPFSQRLRSVLGPTYKPAAFTYGYFFATWSDDSAEKVVLPFGSIKRKKA